MSEVRRLAGLAWPVVLGQLGLVGMGLVDLLVVGRLGEVPLASLGLGNTWSFSLLIIGLGTCSGIDPFVTQAFGRGAPADAGVAALRGALVVGALAIPITALHLLAGPALLALGQPADAVEGAWIYDVRMAAGVAPFLAFALIRQVLQAAGRMRDATWVILLANVVNLVLDVWWVHGLGWGIAGAAWATVVVRWGMLFALLALGAPVLKGLIPDRPVLAPGALRAVAAKALPVGWQVGLEVWAFNAATLLAGSLGTTAVATHSAALNACSVAFMVPMGVGVAAATRVGNLVGRGEDWRGAGWTAIGMGAAVMGFSGLMFVLFPAWIGSMYSPEATVIAGVAAVLPIGAAFGLFDGVQVVAFGVLRGIGDTEKPAWINLIGYWLVGLPLGAWLGLRAGWGLPGVWTGLSVGLGIVAALLLLRVRSWTRPP